MKVATPAEKKLYLRGQFSVLGGNSQIDGDIGTHMTRHTTTPRIRTETRFAVAAGGAVTLRLELQQLGRVVSGCLIDCSVRGMTCQTPLMPEGTVVHAVIAVDNLTLRQEITGVVRWCRLSGKDWCHGIEFNDGLPHAFIFKLLEAGYLDRRQDPRALIELPAQIRSELSGGKTVDVQIVDFSAGGLRIQSAAPVKLENRLLLQRELGDDPQSDSIQVRPMWQQCREGTHVTGCCFLDASGVNVLRTWLQSELVPTQTSARASHRTWFWLSVAASLGIVAAGIMAIL